MLIILEVIIWMLRYAFVLSGFWLLWQGSLNYCYLLRLLRYDSLILLPLKVIGRYSPYFSQSCFLRILSQSCRATHHHYYAGEPCYATPYLYQLMCIYHSRKLRLAIRRENIWIYSSVSKTHFLCGYIERMTVRIPNFP